MRFESVIAGLLSVLLCVTLSAQNVRAIEPQELNNRGFSALAEGRSYEAIEYFKSALQQNPRYLEPLIGLADSYFALGEYEEALAFVKEAQVLDRLNFALLSLEGRIRIGLGEFAVARELFSRILVEEPNNVDAQFGLAELEIAFGRISNAALRYEEALIISPNNRRALLSLVLLFDEAGETDIAEVYNQQALKYYPDNHQVQLVAAEHHMLQDEYALAEFHANVAIELNPGYLDATILLGNIYLVTGEYENAISIIESILAENRDESILWYALGIAYSKIGFIDEAINSYARALMVQPDDEISRIAMENLIMHNLAIDDPIRDRYAKYHFEAGDRLLQRNYMERALLEFRRGLVLTPRSKDSRLKYASLYNTLGFRGKYLTELQVLRDLGYDDDDITDRIEITESLLRDSLTSRWDVDQYALHRRRYKIPVYFQDSSMYHFLGDVEAAEYFRHLLVRYENIDVPTTIIPVKSFSQAFRDARLQQADFFIILTMDEGTRHFGVRCELFGSSTGTLLAAHSALRTGNNRTTQALSTTSGEIVGRLPVSGQIVKREFDAALVDLGTMDGLESEAQFFIVRREGVKLRQDALGFDFEQDDILGTMTITQTDELISEGVIERNPFFDLINPGDVLVPMTPDDATDLESTDRIPFELYRTILKIR
ncbi:MAG: hypothetical protein CMN78_01295 [Spirochaetales bacterium]|nr:hypothetical protein [Spirochaetales bacterium]